MHRGENMDLCLTLVHGSAMGTTTPKQPKINLLFCFVFFFRPSNVRPHLGSKVMAMPRSVTILRPHARSIRRIYSKVVVMVVIERFRQICSKETLQFIPSVSIVQWLQR